MNLASQPPAFWRDRIKASAIHLSLSLIVAAMAGSLVFVVWYPYPYREISGGRELFLILVTVDVILALLITLAALQGVPLAARPDLWQPYGNAVPDILKAAKPVRELKGRRKDQSEAIDKLLRAEGRNPENMLYLPLVGRKSFWTAFLDPVTADIVATLPLDPF